MRSVLLFIVCTLSLQAQQSLPDLVDSLKDRIVNITVFDEEGELGGGTGFIVEGGKIVTNAHVVEGGTSFTVGWDLSVGREDFSATLLASDDRVDLAVLEPLTPVELPEGLAVASDSEVRLGEEVVILGFPWLTQKEEEPEDFSLSVFRGLVTSLRRNSPQSISELVVDANILSGASGSPLFAPALGKVIGVASGVEMSYVWDEGEGEGSEEGYQDDSEDQERIGIACAPSQVLRLLKKAAAGRERVPADR